MKKYSELKVSDFDDIEEINLIAELKDQILGNEDIVVNLFKEKVFESIEEAIDTLEYDEHYLCYFERNNQNKIVMEFMRISDSYLENQKTLFLIDDLNKLNEILSINILGNGNYIVHNRNIIADEQFFFKTIFYNELMNKDIIQNNKYSWLGILHGANLEDKVINRLDINIRDRTTIRNCKIKSINLLLNNSNRVAIYNCNIRNMTVKTCKKDARISLMKSFVDYIKMDITDYNFNDNEYMNLFSLADNFNNLEIIVTEEQYHSVFKDGKEKIEEIIFLMRDTYERVRITVKDEKDDTSNITFI